MATKARRDQGRSKGPRRGKRVGPIRLRPSKAEILKRRQRPLTLVLISMLSFILFLHIFMIDKPSSIVFDEYWYVPAAKDVLAGKVSNLEHPFLGKAIIALGMLSLGDDPYGWRLPIVLFGMGTLYVFYLLAKRLLPESLALYSLAFLSFDNLLFVHSNIAMLEAPSIFFGLLGFFLYFKKRNLLSAVSFGLSFLAKETGALFFIALLVYLVAARCRNLPESFKALLMPSSKAFREVAAFSLTLFVTVAVPMQLYVTAYRPEGMAYFTDHIQFMVSWQTGSSPEVEVPAGAEILVGDWALPWNWVILYSPIDYHTGNYILGDSTVAIRWSGVGSMPLWWGLWLALPSSLLLYIRRRDLRALFITSLIAGTYLPIFLTLLLPLPRVAFPYYFLNTLPALAIGVPYGINNFVHKDWHKALVLGALMISQLAYFAYLFPLDIV